MKKKYIESRDAGVYFQAMNHEYGILCELKTSGEPCDIEEMRLRPGGKSDVQCFMTLFTKNTGKTLRERRPEDVRLYRQEFENGDYVRKQDGKLCIYYKEACGSHLWHTVYEEDSDNLIVWYELDTKSGVMPGDRLCTEEEKTKLNVALLKHGYSFDPEQKEIVKGVYAYKSLCSENKEFFKKFMKGYENFKDWKNIAAPSEYAIGYTQLKGKALLPYPFSCQRGEMKTMSDVAECINAYEDRIEELTRLCDEMYEIYKKFKQEMDK